MDSRSKPGKLNRQFAVRVWQNVPMNLKQIFEDRVKRAARVLEQPTAGPRSISFSSADFSNPIALAAIHEGFPRGKSGVFYLYVLSFDSDDKTLPSKARSAFGRARATKTRNMSRDNDKHEPSKTLYVGTCENLHHRFRTHLGHGDDKTTFALHMSVWAGPLKSAFLVQYYEFNETITEDVELVEGVLWDALHPLFGKKSGRG